MNQVILMGRLTKDPEVRYNDDNMCVAKYTLAVDKRVKKGEAPTADFIRVTAFGNNAEFAEKYLKKGMKMLVVGRVSIGSYMKDEARIYTQDIIVDHQEFCESKKADTDSNNLQPSDDGFMNIPDGLDEEMPFN